MTQPQQSERGWFSTWREQRRIRRQQLSESRLPRHEDGSEFGRHDGGSAYGHSAIYGMGGFGGDGGCGGDGGGGC
jgi:hypothetical protein